MCKYCNANHNDFILLNNTFDYSGIEISMNKQGMLRVRCYCDEMDGFVSQDIINIKYCPVCGEKFKGE